MSNEYLNNKVFEAIIIRFQSSKRNKAKHQYLVEDLKGTYERKSKRHVTQKDDVEVLATGLKTYADAISEFNDSQKHLAVAFYTLSENIVRYAKFKIDDDDAIQEGVMICFEKIDRFDPRKGKAFNYMTTCILNHFRQLYRTARNYNELKKRYQDFMEIQSESAKSVTSVNKKI